jgi:hypothetical protein
VLLFFGVIAFILAMVDGVGVLLGYRLTDVSWSPLVFAVLGLLFVMLEARPKPDRRLG